MEAIPKAKMKNVKKRMVFSTQPKQLFARLKQNEQFSFRDKRNSKAVQAKKSVR